MFIEHLKSKLVNKDELAKTEPSNHRLHHISYNLSHKGVKNSYPQTALQEILWHVWFLSHKSTNM